MAEKDPKGKNILERKNKRVKNQLSNMNEIKENEIKIENECTDALAFVSSENTIVSNSNEEKKKLIIKFDSAASKNMTGCVDRLLNSKEPERDIYVKGFNNNISKVTVVGENKDRKIEYFIPDMPDNLVLLCANEYAKDGAVILLKNKGMVIELSEKELENFQEFVKQFMVQKILKVRNGTYEVEDNDSGFLANSTMESACTAANTYFNTKVNTSNVEERILAYLIAGFTLRDLLKYIQVESVTGFHPEMTVASTRSFEKKWGATPDALQLAMPNRMGNKKGYLAEEEKISRVGQRVEMDYFEPDFNDFNDQDQSNGDIENMNSIVRKRVKKLPSHGGAVAAAVAVDALSGFVIVRLVKSVANAVETVTEVVNRFQTENHVIDLFAADRGVLSQSQFRVITPEVSAYLLDQHIRMQVSEPYNHANGTPRIEEVILRIKQLVRMGIQYIMRNPNLPAISALGFTKRVILKLWGELVYWAAMVINLRTCPNDKKKTKYEVFYGRKPNINKIRMLPIMSVLMVLRYVPNTEVIDESNGPFFQYGIYVGPDYQVNGAIRAAVVTNGTVQIIVSTKFKGVQDGGGLNIYPTVQKGLDLIVGESQSKMDSDIQTIQLTDKDDNSPTVCIENDCKLEKCESGDLEENEELECAKEDTEFTTLETVESTNKPDNDISDFSSPSKHNSSKKKWRSRAERAKKRLAAGRGEAYFVDWSTHKDEDIYFSFDDLKYYVVTGNENDEVFVASEVEIEEGYKVLKSNVPKSYAEALKDRDWGEPSREELHTIMEAKTLVKVNTEIARAEIDSKKADFVILFPIYEEKIKEGKIVRKVRLVCNGKTQNLVGNVYASTPSREELLILLHIYAAFDWEFVHIDEKRAFLQAEKLGEKCYTKIPGSSDYYEIVGALYGLKSSPKDYQIKVIERLKKMGFIQLQMSSCIFVKRTERGIVIIYNFVDDQIIGGNNIELIQEYLTEYRLTVNTTEPIWNPTKFLGIEAIRDRVKRILKITVTEKIEQLGKDHNVMSLKRKNIPISSDGFVIDDANFEEDKYRKVSAFLYKKDVIIYMKLVGSFIWILGIRKDITFAVLYLSWFTQAPRIHHLNVAKSLLSYLYHSKEIPLILGGVPYVKPATFTDCSIGTAPRGRSIAADMTKLHSSSGAIHASSSATVAVRLSSFEGELEAFAKGLKSTNRISNLLTELNIYFEKPDIYSDNEAMLEFVKGNGIAKGIRHIELKLWYSKEQYLKQTAEAHFMEGKYIPSDKMTKPFSYGDFVVFRVDVMGLKLESEQSSSI